MGAQAIADEDAWLSIHLLSSQWIENVLDLIQADLSVGISTFGARKVPSWSRMDRPFA
jgi:hypothetical protein